MISMFNRSHIGVISIRFASWIAIAAILFAALAPTVSHAFLAKNTPQTLWQELCTAQGSKLVATEIDPGTADSQPASPAQDNVGIHFEHCPYCFSHAGSVGLPPATTAFLFVATGKPAQLTAIYIAPVLPFYQQSANPPQAPPSVY